MATPVRSAAARIDWGALSSKLKPETVAAINAFRRRHTELTKTVNELRDQTATIDFEYYRRTLKNKKVVDAGEKSYKSFTPATYDLGEQLRIIESQEAKAVCRTLLPDQAQDSFLMNSFTCRSLLLRRPQRR